MIKREFQNDKLQELYNAELAKELAKLDAQDEKKNKSNNPLWRILFYFSLFSILLYFLWSSFRNI